MVDKLLYLWENSPVNSNHKCYWSNHSTGVTWERQSISGCLVSVWISHLHSVFPCLLFSPMLMFNTALTNMGGLALLHSKHLEPLLQSLTPRWGRNQRPFKGIHEMSLWAQNPLTGAYSCASPLVCVPLFLSLLWRENVFSVHCGGCKPEINLCIVSIRSTPMWLMGILTIHIVMLGTFYWWAASSKMC
jgi:hypothetical protein